MPRALALALAVSLAAFLPLGCQRGGDGAEPPTGIAPEDLQTEGDADDGPFDPGALISSEAFTDTFSFDEGRVQRLFERSPYRRPSFLETYRSNGLRASAAIVAAGRRYGINPLVLVVHLQVARGLVAERTYPLPGRNVEFVFDCGCSSARVCDPEYAGIDRQVECLAATLREHLDAIEERGETVSGWAPGRATRTLDGVEVTPVNDATAALYTYLPRVQVGGRGNWLFERLFRRYAEQEGYFPVPPP